MNLQQQTACQEFLDRWKADLESDAPIAGSEMVESVANLFRQVQCLEETEEEKKLIAYYQLEAQAYSKDLECEIDSCPVVSLSDDPIERQQGAYVQAWVWIDGPTHNEENDEEERPADLTGMFQTACSHSSVTFKASLGMHCSFCGYQFPKKED